MRLIDADAVKRSIWREWLGSRTTKEKELCDILEKIIDCCCEHIDNAPTIDAEPVVHGRWKKILQNNDGTSDYECSACLGLILDVPDDDEHELVKHCPNCGAKMDEVSE